jgi:hypothetical protein
MRRTCDGCVASLRQKVAHQRFHGATCRNRGGKPTTGDGLLVAATERELVSIGQLDTRVGSRLWSWPVG